MHCVTWPRPRPTSAGTHLQGMGEIGIEPDKNLAAFKLAVQRLTPEREAALQAEAQAEARVATNDVDAEKVAADAESLDVALESLTAAERRLRIYEDVLATLNAPRPRR